MELESGIQQLNDPVVIKADKYKIFNSITNKIEAGEYLKEKLEESFKIETIFNSSTFVKRLFANYLNATKNNDKILSALTCENDEIINFVIKYCDNFWSNEYFSPDFFINNIFTNVSYSHRHQIIKVLVKYTNNEQRAQAFFDELSKTYNLSTARPFLKKCSLEFWLSLSKQKYYLESKELFDVVDLRSHDCLVYLEHILEPSHMGYYTACNYKNILIELFSKYPDNILKLYLKNDNIQALFSSTSRKTTKRIVKLFPEVLISRGRRIKCNKYVLFKYFSKVQMEQYICELFKDGDYCGIPDMNYCVRVMWEMYKRKQDKLDMLKRCYLKYYQKDIFDSPKMIKTTLLDWIEDNELRHKIAVQKFENVWIGEHEDVNTYIPYMKIDTSIPKLKELIRNTMNANDRSTFLQKLLDTCKINNDRSALLNVLKYFNMKHKNEVASIRIDFLSHFIDLFEEEIIKLDQLHWDEILKILQNLEVKGDLRENHVPVQVFASSFEFSYKMKNKNLFETFFNLFLKWTTSYPTRFIDTLKEISTKAVIFWIEEFVTPDYHESLLNFFHYYNKEHKDDSIDICSYNWALKIYREKLNDLTDDTNLYEWCTIIKYVETDSKVAKHFDNQLVEIKKRLLRKCDLTYFTTFVKYIHLDPEYTESALPLLLEEFIKYLKDKERTSKELRGSLLSFEKVPKFKELILKKCNEILKNQETDYLKGEALYMLCPYMKDKEFFEITKPYFPKDKTAETGTDETQHKYRFQKQIAYSLKSFKSNPETLEALKIFCCGDFLQLTVGSLNCICLKIPFYKSKEFLKNNINTPISFKKHVLRLLFTMLDKKELALIVQSSWSSETNPTTRNIILDGVLNLLVSESDKDIWWKILSYCIQELNHKDKDILEKLSLMHNIPSSCISKYAELVWKKILEVEKEVPDLVKKRQDMFSRINTNFKSIEDEFIEYLLSENLFNMSISYKYNNLMEDINTTAILYILRYRNSLQKQNNCFAFVFTKLKAAVEQYWNIFDDERKSHVMREIVSNFLENMVVKISVIDVNAKNEVLPLITNFIENLEKVFPSELNFKDYKLQFEILSIFFDVNKNILELGKRIQEIVEREINKYGSLMIEYLAKTIKEFLYKLSYNTKLEKEDLIKGLLIKPEKSYDCDLVVYYLITDHMIIRCEEQKKYCELLLERGDQRLKLFMDNKYKIVYGQ